MTYEIWLTVLGADGDLQQTRVGYARTKALAIRKAKQAAGRGAVLVPHYGMTIAYDGPNGRAFIG